MYQGPKSYSGLWVFLLIHMLQIKRGQLEVTVDLFKNNNEKEQIFYPIKLKNQSLVEIRYFISFKLQEEKFRW